MQGLAALANRFGLLLFDFDDKTLSLLILACLRCLVGLLLDFLGGSKLLLAGLLFSLLLFNLGSELLTQMLAKPVYHTGHHFDGLAQLLERDQRPFRIVVQLVLVTHTAIVPIVVINFLLLVCRPGSIPGSIPGQRTARLILNNSGLEKVLFFA